MWPIAITRATCTNALQMALPISPPKYETGGSGVPLIRLRMPCSRRKTTLNASAVKVVVITDMPAIPGIRISRSFSLRPNTPAIRNRKISGSAKLKKAALGLRQNIRRSKRNWRQASEAVLTGGSPGARLRLHDRLGDRRGLVVGGELEVD